MLVDLIPTESQEAQTLVAWLRVQGLKFHHSPGETGSSPEMRRRAVRMKREGTSRGFADYVILIPKDRSVTGDGFCLFIELKRKRKSVISKEQWGWHDAINALDVVPVASYIALGADHAISIVSQHLAKTRSDSPF